MKVLIENKDSRPLSGFYRPKTNNDTKVVKHLDLPANDAILVDEDIFNAVITVNDGNNTISDAIKRGVVLVHSADGQPNIGNSEESKLAMNIATQKYQQIVSIYREVQAQGGKSSKELAPYLDDNGIPNYELVKKNTGNQINAQDYDRYAARIAKEIKQGLHQNSLVIPGGSPEKKVDKVDENTIKENPTTESVDYDKWLTILEDSLEELNDNNGFQSNGLPKVGALNEILPTIINGKQRDHLWSMYKAKHEKVEPKEA